MLLWKVAPELEKFERTRGGPFQSRPMIFHQYPVLGSVGVVVYLRMMVTQDAWAVCQVP